MYAHLLERQIAHALIRPNLLVLTGPTVRRGVVGEEHGALVAMLLLKAG